MNFLFFLSGTKWAWFFILDKLQTGARTFSTPEQLECVFLCSFLSPISCERAQCSAGIPPSRLWPRVFPGIVSVWA